MKKTWMIAGLGCALLGACESVDHGVAETRPVGEPVLSPAQLKEAKTAVVFTTHVKPILEERCLHCHNGKEMPGKFSLETRAEAMKGGRIVPGDAGKSLLIVALTTGNHAMTMPAVGTAPPKEEVDVLKAWINAGAKWPDSERLRPKR